MSARLKLKQSIAWEPANHAALQALYVADFYDENFRTALAISRRAVALAPVDAEDHVNLALILARLDRHDESLACLKRALALSPHHSSAWHALGRYFAASPLGADAAACACQRAVSISPQALAAWRSLATAYYFQGRIREFIKIKRAILPLDPGDAAAYYDLLPHLHLDPDLAPAEQFAFRRRVHRRFSDPLTRRVERHANVRDPDRCLKIGYADELRRNTHSPLLLPVVEAHDPRSVAAYFYTDLPEAAADEITARFRAVAVRVRHVGHLSDEDLAHVIREDGIDVLVDTRSHYTGGRVGTFARKPAPLQVTMFQAGSSGLRAMDYAVADPIQLPPGAEAAFVEEIICVPTAFLFDALEDVPSIPRRASSSQSVTFGSFNQLVKLNDGVLTLWASILRAVQGSRLLLKASGLAGPHTRQRIEAVFAANGVASDRLDLRSWTRSYAEHLDAFSEIDVALDCFPYPGVVTTLEALHMGVPVVTMAGDRFVSRYGCALMTAVGHPEWVGRNEGEYEAIAVALAGVGRRHDTLRQRLRAELLSSPICDTGKYARAFEAGLRAAWRKWCETGPRLLARHG